MTENEKNAIEAAEREGLFFLRAVTADGNVKQCVETDWESAGYGVDDMRNPVVDSFGNTVVECVVEDIDRDNPIHVAQVCEWYG